MQKAMRPLSLPVLLLALALPGQKKAPEPKEDPATLQDFVAVQTFLEQYKVGAIRLMKEGVDDPQALAQVDQVLGALAKWNTLRAVTKLFEVAALDPSPPGAEGPSARIDFHRELQPWKVRDLARRHIAAMQCEGLDHWLIGKLEVKTRGGGEEQLRPEREAAMRILALRGGLAAREALLKATQVLPPAERVLAVQTLGEGAALDSVGDLLGMLADKEPNARIAAINSLGKALGPHTDETQPEKAPPAVAALRDQAIDKLKGLLLKDPVWQVRSAAAESLVALRCKAAIPVLIQGLEAELARAKDPWALDLRLPKLLEGLTGQKVLPGSAAPWKEFWKREAATFAFARTAGEHAAAKTSQQQARYQKFFNLEVDSRRMLFVLDFSGSMAEPAHLKPKGPEGTQSPVQAGPGSTQTKAQLVVQELKKMVMALPEGSLFNMVVFADDVRVWRASPDGKPGLVKIDDHARDDLLGSFLDSLQPHGPTNLHGALDVALGFAGRGLYDKWYATSFDTLYVLSDGAPSYGAVTDKAEICRLVREANGLRKVVIHTVTFGDKNDTDFLRKMAEENGGRHIHVE